MAAGPRPPEPADVAVPAGIGEVVRPRYGSRSLAEVVPAVAGHLLGRGTEHPLAAGLTGTKVVVLVVDGLGARQLARRPDVAPVLSSLPGGDVDAVFPSTTVTSLASIGTGRPPSQHGLVGYSFGVPGHRHPLNGLGWRIGLRGGGFDARSVLVPEALQPEPTAFERAVEDGIAVTVVVHPDFPDSGLTRAVLRGGQRRTADGLGATLDLAVEAVAAADGPALAYAHHPQVDWAGHTSGACSGDWADAVRDVDTALGRLRQHLPKDVTVLVTADHGMLTIDEADVVELSTHPDLAEGVRTLAGEPRVRHVHLEDGVEVPAVVARWRRTLGDRAVVATRDEALDLFGPDPRAAARTHVGDLVVLARRGTLVHARVDPHGGRHRGQHGGPTTAERLVPLRRLTRS